MRLRSIRATLAVATLLLPALSGAQNRALGRPTFASSIYGPGAAFATPDKVVDGNTDGNYFDGSLFHSGFQAGDWWYVQLDQAYDITQIDFWNRTDCCNNRIVGATLGIFDAAPYGPGGPAPLWTNALTPFTTVAHQTFLPPGVSGQYVGIHAPLSGDAWLQIAELEVLGTPTVAATAPEPATVVLLGGGLLAIAGMARRRRA